MHVHRSSFIVHHSESGQQAVLIAVLTPLLIAAAGVLADAGLLLVEYRRAQVALDSAAFAAAQRVDTSAFLAGQAIILDPAQALPVGGLYGSLNSRGSVRITAIEVQSGAVIARGYALVEPRFLALFGAGTARLDLASSAMPAYGIWREGQ